MLGHGSTLLFLVLLPRHCQLSPHAHILFYFFRVCVSLSISVAPLIRIVNVDSCGQHISTRRSHFVVASPLSAKPLHCAVLANYCPVRYEGERWPCMVNCTRRWCESLVGLARKCVPDICVLERLALLVKHASHWWNEPHFLLNW